MIFNKKISVYLLAFITLTASCKKDFFDLQPYDALPVEDAIETDGDLNVIVNGMYSNLRSVNLYGRTLPVKGDLAADNVYLKGNNSGRYLELRDYNQTAANSDALGVWNSAYIAIKNANIIIHADLASSPIVDQLKGEAYAVRALMHFELVRNFAKPYTVDANALGVPVVTSFEQDARPARNTVREVYAQIISDLNQAFTLMNFSQGETVEITSTGGTRLMTSEYFTPYAAKGLLAKVYLHMGEWANARDAALEVVNNSGFVLVSAGNYVDYWSDPGTQTDQVETLFEVSSDAAANLSSNSLSNFYSLEGYGDIWVTNELYEKYRPGDVRLDVIEVSVDDIMPGQTVYLVQKYPNTTNPADKDDTKVLRFADILLILAEAHARLGQEDDARMRLNQVAQNREPGFAGYNSSGAELINDIIEERRKELAFEGDRYWDLMRLNLPITNHTTSQHPLILLPIEVNNFRRIYPIPQSELDANENIRGQQNQGY